MLKKPGTFSKARPTSFRYQSDLSPTAPLFPFKIKLYPGDVSERYSNVLACERMCSVKVLLRGLLA